MCITLLETSDVIPPRPDAVSTAPRLAASQEESHQPPLDAAIISVSTASLPLPPTSPRTLPIERFCPFQDTGSIGDKGVLAVPVDYGDNGDGVLKIDWPAIEAANAGVHLPDETEEHYTRRILFSRVRAEAAAMVILFFFVGSHVLSLNINR